MNYINQEGNRRGEGRIMVHICIYDIKEGGGEYYGADMYI